VFFPALDTSQQVSNVRRVRLAGRGSSSAGFGQNLLDMLQADAKRPIRRLWAPENAPRSWPNNSLSSRVSGMAAQLMAMNGLVDRSLC